jgi:hypothetical protein
MQVLEVSNDQDHADGNVERRGIHADGNVEGRGIHDSEEAAGVYSNAISSKAPRASHGVAQDAIHAQVASQGTGVANAHNADNTQCEALSIYICMYEV